MGLSKYWQKRDFNITPEPKGRVMSSGNDLAFFIQKHHAHRLHYDFRLELNGTLKSWAIPKGPSLDPKDKRLAVLVEDHPISYGDFEGDIPAHQYGAGHVLLWDRGIWEPIGDPEKSYKEGSLKFMLYGIKLSGRWALVRMKTATQKDKENWLLIKEKDEEAKIGTEADITENHPESVKHLTPKKNESSHPKIPEMEDALTEKSIVPMPESYKPQLATLAQKVPTGEGWITEVKYDGYRALTKIDRQHITMYSRNGNDWTDKWAAIAKSIKNLGIDQAWLDGEVVALKSDGSISFQELQNFARLGKNVQLAYFIFDVMYLNGHDVTQLPLINRKELLQGILDGVDPATGLYYSPHAEGDTDIAFHSACGHRLEGIVAKRKDAEYQQFRSHDWLKVKCGHRQEFVIAGYTDPAGSRDKFGALLLGFYDAQGSLHYAGRVGTGFNSESLATISKLITKMQRDEPAFIDPPKGQDLHGVHWLQPKLVAEVQFAQWTDSGVIRHSSFIGLRLDKPAAEISQEKALSSAEVDSMETRHSHSNPQSKTTSSKQSAKLKQSTNNFAGVSLTHPDKILIPEGGISKADLANYYQEVERWVLPHLLDRPLSIVRCPDGSDKECFFQKHAISANDAIQKIVVPTSAKDKEYMLANDMKAVISLVQLGVLEFHTWGARKGHLEQPDRLVFDLDPDAGLQWQLVVEAAQLTRGLLHEIGLESFIKTSGGKGLHVVVPILPKYDWAVIKNFTKSLAHHLEKQIPDRFTANISKGKRHNKIFIDYLRNESGATTIAAYSTRARPNAPVSVPIFWDELDAGIKSDSYTIMNIAERLNHLMEDPWKEYWTLKQQLTPKILKAFN